MRSLISKVLVALFFLNTLACFADLAEADRAEDKARSSFVEHFVSFLQDKNVMGKVNTPDGKKADPGPNKNRFDQDDGVSYRSDLTYHDFSYNTQDEQFAKKNEAAAKIGAQNKGPNTRQLPAFVSEHGGISAGGGSSLLERTVYGLHERFFKEEQDEKKRKEEDEKKGIKYKSVYKVETRDVFKADVDPNAAKPGAGATAGAGGAGGAQPAKKKDAEAKEEPEKVERFTLREEAKPDVENVGVQAFKSVEKASRDKENQNDDKTLSNSTLLYEAAGRATDAWWNTTLANLGQRKINRAVKADIRPNLSEGLASCDAWGKKALQEKLAELQKSGKPDPKEIQALQAEIKQTQDKCSQVSKLDYSTVNPKYEPTEDGKGEKLSTGDILKEDGFSRDLRNQLEVLGSAGKDVTKLKTNWKYDAKEDKQEVTTGFDENTGEANQKEQLSVREQLESYNNQLDEAKKGFQGVKERFPQLEVNEKDIDNFKIEPESRSVMEINGLTAGMKDDLGVDPKTQEAPPPQTYDELVQKNQGQ